MRFSRYKNQLCLHFNNLGINDISWVELNEKSIKEAFFAFTRTNSIIQETPINEVDFAYKFLAIDFANNRLEKVHLTAVTKYMFPIFQEIFNDNIFLDSVFKIFCNLSLSQFQAQIETFNFTYNSIISFAIGDGNFTNLKVLLFNHNSLRSIPSDIHSVLPSLSILSLSSNLFDTESDLDNFVNHTKLIFFDI